MTNVGTSSAAIFNMSIPQGAAGSGSGTVTSVASGTGLTGGPITATGTLSIDSTVATLTGSQTLTNKTLTAPVVNSPTGIVKGDVGLGNVDNTSDATKNAAVATLTNKSIDAGQLTGTIAAGRMPAHTGDATSSAGSVALTLANVNSNVGSFSNANITVNAKGLITAASTGSGGSGTVTSVSVATANGVSGSVANATTTPAITLTLGDISAATSKPSATGSSVRSFATRAGDVFNVRDFGAVGNNSTDDYNAIVAAITAAQAATYAGAVYFPAGTYYVGTRINMNLSKDLDIFGDGNTTRIAPRGAGGGFKFTATSNDVAITMRDFRLSACVNSVGIEIICLPASTIHYKNLLVLQNLLLDVGTTYWSKGLVVSSAHNMIIKDCLFYGQPSGSIGVGNAVEIAAICVNSAISNCNFNFWEYGIYCPVYQEGLIITNSVMVVVKYGVYLASNHGSALRSTLLQLVNTHIDARGSGSRAVWCNNVSALLMTNCLLIGEEYIMKLVRTYESTIMNNQIYGPATRGISLEDSGGLSCIAVTIIGNVFRGPTTDIYADTGTRRIVAQNNVRNDSDSAMTVVYMTTTDNGSSNNIQATGT